MSWPCCRWSEYLTEAGDQEARDAEMKIWRAPPPHSHHPIKLLRCPECPAGLMTWGYSSLVCTCLFPHSIKIKLLVCNLYKLCDLFLVMELNLTPFTLTFLNRELLVPRGIQCCLQLTQLIAQSRHLMWHIASWKHNWLLRWRNMHFRVEFAMTELLVQSKPGIWIPGLYIKISATIRHSWIKLQTQSLPFCLHNFPFALFIKSCKFQSEYLQG